jgi:aspartate racemase
MNDTQSKALVMNDNPPLLGVLGGMGPLATVDFLKKLIEETPATRDQEHIPVVTYCVPQIPDRPAAILHGAESPLPHMLKGIATLKNAGAQAIAIACNTAHYWYDDLVQQGGLPIIHIADAACDDLAARGIRAARVGLIATKGTVAAGFFQQRFAQHGFECILNSDSEQDQCVLPAIEHVKRNELAAAHALAVRAAQGLRSRGAEAIVLGCTEIPLAIDHAPSDIAAACADATRALARTCVKWWQAQPANVRSSARRTER